MRKWRKILLALTCAALASFIVLNLYKQRSTFRCQVCSSWQHRIQWHIGGWGSGFSFLISPERIVVEESHASRLLFTTTHTHNWVFAQGSPYWLGFKWSGCAIGAGRHQNEFSRLYESSAEFRSFVEAKTKQGFSTESIHTLMAQRPFPSPSEESDPKYAATRALSSGFVEDLFNSSSKK
jgi:hypothetical protein